MVIKRRIETSKAKELRGKRKHFAAPGGSHDKLVGFLAKALPMAVGVLAAFMIVTPLSPRGEVSFLLDRNKVAVIKERLRVDNAMYRGEDNQGRPFSLTAGEAVQRSSSEGIVRMEELVARLLMNSGPAKLDAPSGAYNIDQELFDVDGEVRLETADGYAMLARNVTVDLDGKRMTGTGGVSGAVPAGTFSANAIEVDMEERAVTLDGNAKLRMVPGRLRIP